MPKQPSPYHLPMAWCTACAGRLRKATLYKKACVYGFHKPRMTKVQTLRCRTRGCETRFGPNWAWSKGSKCSKMNVVKIGDLNRDSRRPAQPLFISTTCGFDLEFLEFALQLMFRSGCGWKALGYAVAQVYPFDTHPRHWCSLLAEGVKYYTMLKELSPLNMHLNISIGSIGTLNLKKFREHVHKTVFPKASPSSSVVVIDGHAKVFFYRMGGGCKIQPERGPWHPEHLCTASCSWFPFVGGWGRAFIGHVYARRPFFFFFFIAIGLLVQILITGTDED